MEIREECITRMEDCDAPHSPTAVRPVVVEDTEEEEEEEEVEGRRPVSPCDSEISVGCEGDPLNEDINSPMDMTTTAAATGANNTMDATSLTEESEGDAPMDPASPSTSRGAPSPAMSSGSMQTESYTYLSDDDYFRPLKRLAMSSNTSPTPSSQPTSPQGRLHHHHHHLHLQVPSPSPPPAPTQQQHQPQQKQHQQQPQPQQHNPTAGGGGEVGERGEGGGGEEGGGAGGGGRVDGGGIPEDQKGSGLRSFSILDILSYRPSRRKSTVPVKIVRPWDSREDQQERPADSRGDPKRTAQNHGGSREVPTAAPTEAQRKGQAGERGGALDALFKMTNKTLDNLHKEDKTDPVNLFNNRQPPKKKRKSRTAFTNHQIFELEKRFLYQKYLSPADRDELAQSLGLSNAQVITWFQNRRAKLKRDMEELKRDVENSKIPFSNKAILDASINVAALLKGKEMPKIPIVTLPHS